MMHSFRSCMFLSFSEICQLWADHHSTGPLFLILLYSCFLLIMQFFSLRGLGAVGRILILLKFCNFFFFCLGAYRSLLSGWGPLKRKYLLKISKNPEPLKTFFSCDCLAVSHWDLVISHLIALTDNLEYVGFLSLVSLFTLKTCCQLFPFRMESSPGEWLVAFRSSFPF